ncbi:MAG: PilW family protein [Gammaproteobacteria bacterium]|nr:PilW family protein [Gammaproteobacteria bacterium]
MSPHQDIKYRSGGFSLVEIMVGMVISLLGVLIVLQVFAAFEGQKRTTTSGSDAQTNGAIAIYTVERDVRMAGYGFSMPEALGCAINRSYNGTTLTALSLAPVTITQGVGGLPDTIEILSSSKGNWSIPARVTTDHPATATNFFLNTTLGMAVGDLLIAYEPGKDCTLLQVTGIPNGNVQVHHQNTSPWDPPGGQNIFPPGGYSAGATLFNLGSLVDHVYSLDANSNLILSDYNSATNTSNVQSLLPDIVNLQAQYGFDTRAGTQTDARVDTWSDAMIDADSNGTAGSSGDIARIYAVRLAVVARSALKEKADSSGTCVTTTATSVNIPTWSGGTIDVSKNPDGTANGDWQCYRYKTFETVIPLRNLIWRQS